MNVYLLLLISNQGLKSDVGPQLPPHLASAIEDGDAVPPPSSSVPYAADSRAEMPRSQAPSRTTMAQRKLFFFFFFFFFFCSVLPTRSVAQLPLCHSKRRSISEREPEKCGKIPLWLNGMMVS